MTFRQANGSVYCFCPSLEAAMPLVFFTEGNNASHARLPKGAEHISRLP